MRQTRRQLSHSSIFDMATNKYWNLFGRLLLMFVLFTVNTSLNSIQKQKYNINSEISPTFYRPETTNRYQFQNGVINAASSLVSTSNQSSAIRNSLHCKSGVGVQISARSKNFKLLQFPFSFIIAEISRKFFTNCIGNLPSFLKRKCFMIST